MNLNEQFKKAIKDNDFGEVFSTRCYWDRYDRYKIKDTNFIIHVHPEAIYWEVEGFSAELGCPTLEDADFFNDVLPNVSDKIQNFLLSNLDIFKHCSGPGLPIPVGLRRH